MRRPHRRPTARDGFTLVEVVVAIVILAIGLLSSASVVGSASRRQMRSTSRIEMMAVAGAKLEHLRAIAARPTSADSLQLKVGGSATSAVSGYSEVFTTPAGKTYQTRWAVTAGPVGTRTVTLRVVAQPRANNDLANLEFTSTFLLLTR